MIETGDLTDTVYIDFSKVFKSVSHSYLIEKLQAYGATGGLFVWIRAILDGKWQRVLVNGCMSYWIPVMSAVPHPRALYMPNYKPIVEYNIAYNL